MSVIHYSIDLGKEEDQCTMVNGYHYSRNVSTIPEEDEDADETHDPSVELIVSTEVSTKEVPSQKWDFTLNNFLQSKCLGENYILAGMSENKSTVFKIKLIEWRTIVADYLGLNSLYDASNVVNTNEMSDFNNFNTRMLRDYTPICRQVTDEQQHRKITFYLTKFFQETMKDVTIRYISESVQLEFEKIQRCSKKAAKDAFDLDNAIKKAVVKVVLAVFLGETSREKYPDHDLIFDWREHLTRNGILDSIFSLVMMGKEKTITNNLFTMFNSMQKIKEARILYPDADFEKILNEIVYSIGWVAIGDLSSTIMACARGYLKLSSKYKRDLISESKLFFEASNDDLNNLLPELTSIHAFYMEIIRLFPLEPRFLRRAKKDFVMRSTSGNFAINEGDLLCGYPYIARRDPNVFEKPNRIILNRCIEDRRYDYAYGGLYPDNSTRRSYGDIFPATCERIIKVFILFLTKCSVTPTEAPAKTDFENPNVDHVLNVKDFHYDR